MVGGSLTVTQTTCCDSVTCTHCRSHTSNDTRQHVVNHSYWQVVPSCVYWIPTTLDCTCSRYQGVTQRDVAVPVYILNLQWACKHHSSSKVARRLPIKSSWMMWRLTTWAQLYSSTSLCVPKVHSHQSHVTTDSLTKQFHLLNLFLHWIKFSHCWSCECPL